MNEKRSKMKVITDVLRVIEKENGRAKPTHILYRANLSHKLLKEYLNVLLQKGFIEVVIEENHTYYRITEEGKKVMGEFRKMEKLSQVLGLPI